MDKCKVYLVGAGPGDPDLITVKGLKILQQADVVIYDYLVDRNILECTKPGAELICGDELVKEKYSNGFTKRQNLINNLMVKKAKQGKRVVRLKNGDPLIFGRVNEELIALTKNKIEFAVVPGVTAASAAGCFSGIPLTARGISSGVVITTGHESPQKNNNFVDWRKIAQIDTIVLYMVVENLREIVKKLITSGRKETTPVLVISNISKIGQKQVFGNLKNIVEKVKLEKISAPAVAVIGEVVKKGERFNWFKKTKKILFTGLSDEKFFEHGLFFHIPMIEIKNGDASHFAIGDGPKFDWIVFSSRFGVYYFFQRLFELKKDTRSLKGTRIAAIGNSTANKLKEYGVIADLVPQKECSEGLLSEFKKTNIRGKKVFLPRSDIADKGLTEGLKKLGAKVHSYVAYKNVMPDNLPDLDLNFFDEIIFSSPSTVRNFIKRYGIPTPKIKIRTIGPVTKKEAQRWKLKKISLI